MTGVICNDERRFDYHSPEAGSAASVAFPAAFSPFSRALRSRAFFNRYRLIQKITVAQRISPPMTSSSYFLISSSMASSTWPKK